MNHLEQIKKDIEAAIGVPVEVSVFTARDSNGRAEGYIRVRSEGGSDASYRAGAFSTQGIVLDFRAGELAGALAAKGLTAKVDVVWLGAGPGFQVSLVPLNGKGVADIAMFAVENTNVDILRFLVPTSYGATP